MHVTHRSKRRNRTYHGCCAILGKIIRETNIRQKHKVQWWKWKLRKICYRMSDCWLFKKLEIMKNKGLLILVILVIIKIENLINFDKYKN